MTPRSPRTRDAVVGVAVALLGAPLVGTLLHLAGVRLSLPVRAIVGDILPGLTAVVLLTRWSWWRRAGWHAPVWRNLYLLWLPLTLLLLSTLNALPGLRDLDLSRVPAAAVAALVIGFTEEVWFRGILLEALRGRGARVAAIGSAVVFGGLHLLNIRVLGLSSALTQSMGAFAIGLMLGAARVRIGSLWPLILIHAAFDFAYLAGAAPKPRPISAEGVRVLLVLIAVSALYAFVVTRRSKTEPESVSEVVPTLG